MIIWMRALNNEAKVKVMQRNTQDRLKKQALNVL